MKNILLIVLLLTFGKCTEPKRINKDQKDTSIFNSPILEHKIDSLIAYVDGLDEFDSIYCTIMLESKDTIDLLTVFISNGSIARLTESAATFEKRKESIKFHGGVAMKRDTSSVIMIDSLSYDYIKSHIQTNTFSSTLYEHCLTSFSHRIPYKWVFEIKEGLEDIEMHPIIDIQ